MEKLTEFVSKSFDPTKSALSVQYLAQSAARPDPVRSDTPGGAESDSSGPHDLRVTVPHPALTLGLPLDLPRYPGISTAGLPYPLPLLMAHRPAGLPHLPLRHLPASPRSPSPPSPRRYDQPSPKRHRRLSGEERRTPSSHDEDEDVDVEASDHLEEAANLTLGGAAKPRRDPSSASDGTDDDRIPIKSEPTEGLANGDAFVSSSQDAINNNSNHHNSNLHNSKGESGGSRRLVQPVSPSPSPPTGCVAQQSPEPLHPAAAAAAAGGRSPPPALDQTHLSRSPEAPSDDHRHTPGEALCNCCLLQHSSCTLRTLISFSRHTGVCVL